MERIEMTTGFTPADAEMVKGFIGKKLIKMRHQAFHLDTKAFFFVELVFEDSVYRLVADLDAVRYFDVPVEDIVCFHIKEGADTDSQSGLVDDPVDATIKKVSIVTDTVYALREDGKEEYSNAITTGVVFTFTDGTQLGFERLDNFIEGIIIYRGTSVLGSFKDADLWADNSDDYFAAISATRRVDTFE